jgi:predicted ATP-grasp superfamily ATP-dependent carboligase
MQHADDYFRQTNSDRLLEQFFPGWGIGVSVLASKGRVLQAFEHHRVRELAGASYYRISAPLTPELTRVCEAIVAAVPYTGVAMFEFKRNDSGDWILLEVNARPWGSMPLPLALGVDFPYRWYRLLTAGEEAPAVEYRTGVYGRNLVPDLYASWAEAAGLRPGPIPMARFMAGRGVELLRVVTGQEVHDVLVRDDPRPGLAELFEIGAAMRVAWRGPCRGRWRGNGSGPGPRWHRRCATAPAGCACYSCATAISAAAPSPRQRCAPGLATMTRSRSGRRAWCRS